MIDFITPQVNLQKSWSTQMKNKILVVGFIALALVSFLIKLKNSHPSVAAETKMKDLSADTLIPAGFVLMPLEISNITAVSSLIHHYGVIDLYAGAEQNQADLLVSRVKILQAPLNPNQFAILVHEEQSREIMRHGGPYWAVVQSRQVTEPTKISNFIPTTSAIPIKKNHVQNIKKALRPSEIQIEYYQ